MLKIWKFVIISSFFIALHTQAATLNVSPPVGVYQVGSSGVFEVVLDTQGQQVNAVSIELSFSVDALEISNAFFGNSVLTLFPEEPTVDNKNGIIRVVGGTPNGFSGVVPLFRLGFRAKKTGEFTVRFSPSSRVFLNDELGTEVVPTFRSSSFMITSEESLITISSLSHHNENEWYAEKDVDLSWNIREGDGYSFVLDHLPFTVPDDIAEVSRPQHFSGLDDGVWYFHIKIVGCEELRCIAHRQVLIDTTAPEKFLPAVSEVEGKQVVVFSTADKQSGIKEYRVKEWFLPKRIVSSPYEIRLKPLGWKIAVEAVDYAGNVRKASVNHPQKGLASILFTIVAVLIVSIIVIWRVRSRKI